MDIAELKATKKSLTEQLNKWKEEFVAQNGREPVKRDIQSLAIAGTYMEYKVVSAAVKARKAAGSSKAEGGEGPDSDPEPEEQAD